MKILVLNAGSSSQKCCLFEIAGVMPSRMPPPLWESESGAADALSTQLETLWSGPSAVLRDKSEIDIVGHRVVHGGRDFSAPTRITSEVKAAIEKLSPLAPAHNPAALSGIEAVERLLGDVPQIAVFDTAFHTTLPDAAAIYPIPFEWTESGIRRYGFHGISHADCASRVAQMLGRDLDSLRLITCHLGNGASLCAIRNGKSIDTTMGFTPLEGVMMGTRSGSVDPGILLYLMREKGVSAAELDRILNRESGLKGVSKLSGDMREIDAAMASGNARASLAFEIYIHRLRAGIGAMLASLGGLDALVFTGGVGEHSAKVRAAVCGAFGFLGLSLALDKNEDSPIDADIATPESKVRVLVIEAQEDWAIARECWKLAAR